MTHKENADRSPSSVETNPERNTRPTQRTRFPDCAAKDRPPVKNERAREQSRAFIQRYRKVPRPVYEHVAGLLAVYDADTRLFFAHVLVCTFFAGDEGWVPVPSTLIRKELRKAEPELQLLVEAGLLEMKEHEAGRCREWCVSASVLAEYLRLSVEHAHAPRVNLFDGKRTTRREKSVLYDAYKNPLPDLIGTAVRTIEHGYFNDEVARTHLLRLDATYQQAELHARNMLGAEGAGSPAYKAAAKGAKRALAQYRTDASCYDAIWNQGPELVGEGLYRYAMAYKPQACGRITQIGGGAQSCSREMKAALYAGVGTLHKEGLHNYDLQSSQAYILRDEMHRAGFDTSWLDTYLERDKEEYAQRVGLSVEAWKRCLYAVFMGAHLPKSLATSRKGAIKERITADLRSDPDAVDASQELTEGLEQGSDPEEVYRCFEEEIAPFLEPLDSYRLHLEEVWARKNAFSCRGGLHVRNATGITLSWSELRGKAPHVRRARLAAFVLQGREAAFIHCLAALLPEYGIVPISNEHDGLVTLGAIPNEAVERVRGELGMPYALLPEKPLC